MDFKSIPVYRDVNQKVTKKTMNLLTAIVKKEDITDCGNGIYDVKSQTTEGVIYQVDSSVCTCTCPVGRCGARCKHQYGVHLYTSTTLINFPDLSVENRELLHEILQGEPPSPGYYTGLYNASLRDTNSERVVSSFGSIAPSSQGMPSEQPSGIDSIELTEDQIIYDEPLEEFLFGLVREVAPKFKNKDKSNQFFQV